MPLSDATQFIAFTPWYVLAAGLGLLVPLGLVMIGVSSLSSAEAWRTALLALGAAGLGVLAYWAIGFGLHFGGVGLIYSDPALTALVWEWSPLSVNWGSGWGVAGLTGWMLGGGLSWLAYALFLAHLPWVITATALSALALRGRAPALVGFVAALAIGGFVYPLAGNWVQGGGWLNALGRNLLLGHGFIDFGGAGSLFLVISCFGLTALLIWRTSSTSAVDAEGMPKTSLPLTSIVGALVLLVGITGWLWANPLQTSLLSDDYLLRGTVNVLLAALVGVLVPLLYTWFVASQGHAVLSARGLVAGMVAGLAVGPFVTPGAALMAGLVAGATVPFVTYLIDNRLKLDDITGIVSSFGLPAIVGLLLVGLLADGNAGLGWQMTGLDGHLGVMGQGVSGLLVASDYRPDFPGQFQAQLIGVIALILWGLVLGLVVNYPMALITHGLRQSEQRAPAASASPHVQEP